MRPCPPMPASRAKRSAGTRPSAMAASATAVVHRIAPISFTWPPTFPRTVDVAAPIIFPQSRTYPARLDTANIEPTRLISEYLKEPGQVRFGASVSFTFTFLEPLACATTSFDPHPHEHALTCILPPLPTRASSIPIFAASPRKAFCTWRSTASSLPTTSAGLYCSLSQRHVRVPAILYVYICVYATSTAVSHYHLCPCLHLSPSPPPSPP
jgi:hypothetical protein